MELSSKIILIVEDDAGLSELISEKIEEIGYSPVCMLSANNALEWLENNVPFLIVLDFSLPEMNGKEFIIELSLRNEKTPPFIVSTGQGDERVAVEMMKLGAKDYVIKDNNFLQMIPLVISRISREIENEVRLKKAEETLRQRESYLTGIIENQPGLAWVKNTDGQFLMVNETFAKTCGMQSADQLIGKTDLDVWPQEFAEKYRADDRLVIRQKIMLNFEEPVFINGKIEWRLIYKFPIIEGNNEVTGTAGLSFDISERKLAEEKLKASEIALRELNTDKDRFMSIIGHDLKSPINLLFGLSEILTENVRQYDIEQIETISRHINDTAIRTYNLLEDILLWASSQSGKISFEPQKINFTKICAEVIEYYKLSASKKEITINFDANEEIEVVADENMLKTVLRNLISNGLKFTNKGGNIEINNKLKNSMLLFSIKDDGIGMSLNEVNKLFKISQTHSTHGTDNELGTGLGLFLCKEFIEKHNGKIWVESIEGKGSTFLFTLPL